jgi:predicted cupin superfamily sugar epimerase
MNPRKPAAEVTARKANGSLFSPAWASEPRSAKTHQRASLWARMWVSLGQAEFPQSLQYMVAVGTSVVRLGSDVAAGDRPQAIVPAGAWQAAESLGAWTLVGCTVAPGFEFMGFELAPRDWSPS